MKEGLNRAYVFGDFRLDLAERVLWHEETALTLRPKLFDLLVYLVEHRGQVLEKEEIIKGVWGDLNLGAPDNPSANLNVSLSSLRKTLCDDPEKPGYIETVPRRGYRFIASVEAIGEVETEPSDSRIVRAVVEPPRLNPVELSGAALTVQPEKRRWHFSLTPGEAVAALLGALVMAAAFLLLGMKFSGAGWPPGSTVADPSTKAISNVPTPTPNGWLEPSADIQIDELLPAQPNATIGDQRLVLKGIGFHLGQTVTVAFPGGGAGVLGGAQIEKVTAESCELLLDFNGNPGNYSLRINHPAGGHSPWFNFTAAPLIEEPEIERVTVTLWQGTPGGRRIIVVGDHFQQNVQVLLERADGKFEAFGPPQVQRASPKRFELLLAVSLQAGLYKIQARNASGRVSNVAQLRILGP